MGSTALAIAGQQLSPGPSKLFLQKLSNSFLIVLRHCCFKVRSNLFFFFLSGHSSFPPFRSFMPLPGPSRILYPMSVSSRIVLFTFPVWWL